MTAHEAKEIATKKLTDYSEGEMFIIAKAVQQAAERGEFAIRHERLHDLTAQRLRADGYKIEYFSDQRDNESYYTISWT